MAWEIEKGVGVPDINLRTGAKYPWYELEVGDSVSFGKKEFTKAASSARMFGKRHDAKFTARKMKDGGRVWRIT